MSRHGDTDSPVEWTGRAHLVGVSCCECGEGIEVPEGNAEQASRGLAALTCDDCTHDCRDHFGEARNDPATPEFVLAYRCQECGERWTFNVKTGENQVDR